MKWARSNNTTLHAEYEMRAHLKECIEKGEMAPFAATDTMSYHQQKFEVQFIVLAGSHMMAQE